MKLGITKADQLKHNKKPKVSTFGTKKYKIKKKSSKNVLTLEERAYLNHLDSVRDIALCFVCGKNRADDPIEWHHVKNRSSDKKNHFRLIPLCGKKHHRNGDISPHGNAKKWRDLYSYEEQLLYAAKIHLRYLNEH